MKVDGTFLCLAFYAIGAQAFVSPKVVARAMLTSNEPYCSQHHQQQQHPNRVGTPSSSTSMPQNRSTRVTLRRFMYNLPPSGGGNNQNDLAGILTGLGTVAAIALFFASPLGTIFFAITNSLFLLALLFPILAIVAFQAWQFVFTLEGPCPNCGAPVRVLKDDEQPTLCLSCGTLVHKRRGSRGGGGDADSIIEIYNDNTVIYDEMEDGYVGGSAGSVLDAIWNQAKSEQQGLTQQQQSPPGSATGKTESSKASRYRRERTVIDVDAEEE
jgi:hypothetical protein